MKQSTLLYIIIFLFGCLIATGYRLFDMLNNEQIYSLTTASNHDVQVILPEEYELITTQDTLMGYYNKRQNVLYISFNNKRNQNSHINSQNSRHHDTRDQRTSE